MQPKQKEQTVVDKLGSASSGREESGTHYDHDAKLVVAGVLVLTALSGEKFYLTQV